MKSRKECMLFVGRKREKNKIIKSLGQGKNIVLDGKFGIGRTSLVKEITDFMSDERKFVFVDFGLTPGKMSEKLMKELCLPTRFNKSSRKMGYKSMRYRIGNIEEPNNKRIVIVFDNIAKLTGQKIIFLRHLILEKHFQFIAIVENFLSSNDLFLLKALFFPADYLYLNHLKKDDIASFIKLYAQKYKLNWSNNYIHDLTVVAGGHSLSMIEMISNLKGEVHDRKI